MSNSKNINIRVSEEIIKQVEIIKEKEQKKTGYNITTSAIVIKAIQEFITNYKD